MVTDARGHEVPGGGGPSAFLPAFRDFSASINDVMRVPDLATAEAAVADLAGEGIATDGLAWWVADPGALFVRVGEEFIRIRDERDDVEIPDTDWLTVTSLGTGWTAPVTVKARQIGNVVRFSGTIQNTSVGAGDGYVTAFTLPAGIAPPVREEPVSTSTGSTGGGRQGYIDVAKAVKIYTVTGTAAFTRISGGYWAD
ncbi:hypothetical protein [Isoptericola sp. NPDC055881]